jgi:hypothetical protein
MRNSRFVVGERFAVMPSVLVHNPERLFAALLDEKAGAGGFMLVLLPLRLS